MGVMVADPTQPLRSKRTAYYRAWGPASTPLTTLVRVAGSRWTVEEGFEHAKGEVGLATHDHQQGVGQQDQGDEAVPGCPTAHFVLIQAHFAFRVGQSKRALSTPKAKWAWISTKCAVGQPGTASSPWSCWPTPCWWSCVAKRKPRSKKRGR